MFYARGILCHLHIFLCLSEVFTAWTHLSHLLVARLYVTSFSDACVSLCLFQWVIFWYRPLTIQMNPSMVTVQPWRLTHSPPWTVHISVVMVFSVFFTNTVCCLLFCFVVILWVQSGTLSVWLFPVLFCCSSLNNFWDSNWLFSSWTILVNLE